MAHTSRCPESGALIFTLEPHEQEAKDQAEKVKTLEKEITDLKQMVGDLLKKGES